MRFIRAYARDDENPCLIPVDTIDRISISNELGSEEYGIYCVRTDSQYEYEYFDIETSLPTLRDAYDALSKLQDQLNA